MRKREFINIPEENGRDLSSFDPFYPDGIPDGRNYCPTCRTLLFFSNKLNNFRCSNCGYVQRDELQESIMEQIKRQQEEQGQDVVIIKSASSGEILPSRKYKGLANRYHHDSDLKAIIPAQSEHTRRYNPNSIEAKKRQYPGYDKDMEKLEYKGYRLVKTTEKVDEKGLLRVSDNKDKV